MNRKLFTIPATLLMTVSLAACSSNGNKTSQPAGNSMNPTLTSSVINKAMEKALKQAESSGNQQEVLALLGQIQGRNPNDAIVATRYARALREDDQINMAIRTLTPFMQGHNSHAEAVTEMAMTQLALGDFIMAENYAAQAIDLDPNSARAYLALGTAQDAQRRHQDAEISFRQGLKHWKGAPSPILNNLALNLASQGHLEEALSLLEKAKKLAPQRMELERNRRIIATLLETTGPRPPAPSAKPMKGNINENAVEKTNAEDNDAPSAASLNEANIKKENVPKPQTTPKKKLLSNQKLKKGVVADVEDVPKTEKIKAPSYQAESETNQSSMKTNLKNLNLKKINQ